MLKQNLLLMIRKHCILFTVLILTQILSTVLVLFSFGVYQNTLYEKQAMTDKTKTICFRFDGKDAIEAIKKIKDAFPEESLKLNDSLKSISILSILDKEQMSSILEENGVSDTSSILQKSGGRMLLFSQPYFSNGKYDTEEWKNNLYREADLVENWFTGSHYDVGANVCVAPSYLSAMNDGIVSVGGVKYRNLYADNGEDTINFCPEDYPEIQTKLYRPSP